MALSALADVKAILGVTGTAQDARITALIAGAEAQIARLTGLRFGVAEVVEDHPGAVATLGLRERPAVEIVGVLDLATGQTIAEDGYEFDATLGLLRRLPWGHAWDGASPPGPFADPLGFGPGAIRPRWRVSYDAGYAAMPEDLLLAVAEMVAASMAQQGGVTSVKDGDFAQSFSAPAGVPASAMVIMQGYMRVM